MTQRQNPTQNNNDIQNNYPSSTLDIDRNYSSYQNYAIGQNAIQQTSNYPQLIRLFQYPSWRSSSYYQSDSSYTRNQCTFCEPSSLQINQTQILPSSFQNNQTQILPSSLFQNSQTQIEISSLQNNQSQILTSQLNSFMSQQSLEQNINFFNQIQKSGFYNQKYKNQDESSFQALMIDLKLSKSQQTKQNTSSQLSSFIPLSTLNLNSSSNQNLTNQKSANVKSADGQIIIKDKCQCEQVQKLNQQKPQIDESISIEGMENNSEIRDISVIVKNSEQNQWCQYFDQILQFIREEKKCQFQSAQQALKMQTSFCFQNLMFFKQIANCCCSEERQYIRIFQILELTQKSILQQFKQFF